VAHVSQLLFGKKLICVRSSYLGLGSHGPAVGGVRPAAAAVGYGRVF